MSLEYKEFAVTVSDVHTDGDKGKAVILLSPYDNVDLGNDRVKPSIAARNEGKKLPLLSQHQVGTEHGHMDLFSTPEGIKANITLYLEKDEGAIIFPEAHKHYALLKRAETDGVAVKYSIGYNTLAYKYVIEGKTTIRDLLDIDIMEGSRVTFPMNPMAQNVQGSVKSVEGGKELEFMIGTKAFSFNQVLQLEELRRMRYRVNDALNDAIRGIMNDVSINTIQKVALIDASLQEYHDTCIEMYKLLIEAEDESQKQLDATELVEKASSIFMHEIKAGAAISKPNAERLQGIMKAVSEVMGCNWDKIQKAMFGDETDDEEDPPPDDEEKAAGEDLEFKALCEGFLDYAKNMKKDEV
ncbi:MAG: hypothetical protein CVU99_02460 [Firmicutes bacterium HGW-Firmicutes-4]|nr:MAG: hypothetical protein CVU99_02460 [Firmicutes bacterium HGW-Firmicutes-4]